MSDALLDRRALGDLLGVAPRTVSRWKHLIPPDLILPGGQPRWRRETIEKGLQRLRRGRRPRPMPERGEKGRFAPGGSE